MSSQQTSPPPAAAKAQHTVHEDKNVYSVRQFLINNLSGGLAGGIGVYIGVPFDIVKVRLQTYPKLYKSAASTLFAICRTEGITKGLFKGSLVPVLSIIPANALAFSGEDFFRSILRKHVYKSESPLSTFDSFLAGMYGGIMQCLVLVPSEVIKCNMQTDNIRSGFDKPRFAGNYDCIKHVWKSEGLRGLYKGGCVTVIREAPGFGVYFASYHLFTDYFTEQVYDEVSKLVEMKTPKWAVLIGGGLAGCCSWLSIYPFDVIKTNIMIEQGGKGTDRTKLSTLGMGRHLFKTHGPYIFARGLGPTLARAFPVNAATFYFLDYFKEILKFDRPSSSSSSSSALPST